MAFPTEYGCFCSPREWAYHVECDDMTKRYLASSEEPDEVAVDQLRRRARGETEDEEGPSWRRTEGRDTLDDELSHV